MCGSTVWCSRYGVRSTTEWKKNSKILRVLASFEFSTTVLRSTELCCPDALARFSRRCLRRSSGRPPEADDDDDDDGRMLIDVTTSQQYRSTPTQAYLLDGTDDSSVRPRTYRQVEDTFPSTKSSYCFTAHPTTMKSRQLMPRSFRGAPLPHYPRGPLLVQLKDKFDFMTFAT